MSRNRNFFFISLTLLQLISCQNEVVESSSVEIEATSSNVIIGKDDRRKTVGSSIPSSMYNKVGRLYTKISDSKNSTCTASLIGSNYILTAAHCAYGKDGELLKNTYFYPALNGLNKVVKGRYPVEKVYHPKNYNHFNFEPSDDLAIMKIGKGLNNKSAGKLLGTFGFWGKDEFPEGKNLTIGYPGDKRDSIQYYQSDCNIENTFYENRLEFDCDNYPGQSGSPLLVYSEEYKSYYIHGIYSGENKILQRNYGSHLSSERQDIINAILNDTFDVKSTEFNEEWGEYNMENNTTVNILVENTCHKKDVYIAINYKNVDDEWIKEGFYAIGSNETFEIARSLNAVFYIHARDRRRNQIISGNVVFSVPDRGSFKFKKYETNKWGDFKVQVPCN